MSYYIMFIVALLNLTATALRPINVAVIAKTDGYEYAGTDDRPWLKLSINGNWREARFPDLPGDDYMRHKSDWFEWPAHQFYGFNDLDDLNGIIIRNGGNDGWKYEDISVFVEDENNNWHVVAMHHETNLWVDGDDEHPNEQTVSMNGLCEDIKENVDDECSDQTKIVVSADCQRIAQENGYHWDGNRNWSDRPFGCLLTLADNQVNFNVNEDGVGSNPDQRAMCNVCNDITNKWQQCLATGFIREVQLFALTEGRKNAGSDDAAQLIIETSTGHTETRTLSNLDGDDYLENKSDWWKWGWSRSYRTTQITGIKLKSGGSDAWNPSRAMVVFKTSDNMYQVLAMDRSIGWLEDRREERLTLTHCPFQYTDAIGYWGQYASGNGGPWSHHTIRYSFSQGETDTLTQAESEERFRSTTAGLTIGVDTGFEFEGLSAKQKYESSISNTNSLTKRREVQNAIAKSVSQSSEYEHEARPPAHIPDGEHYTLYVWNVFRKNNYGEGANLITFDYIFKWGACRDVYPNCVSSSTCADDDCMTCSTPDAVIDTSYQGVRSSCLPHASAGRRSLKHAEHRRLIDELSK